MKEKYIKVDWPETQDFMILKVYKDFYTGYLNADDGTSSLFVPESIYNQFVDLKPTTMAL